MRPSSTCSSFSAAILCGAMPSMRCPSKVIAPPEFFPSRPEIVRKRVVLPAPFEPISDTISPRRTSKATLFSA